MVCFGLSFITRNRTKPAYFWQGPYAQSGGKMCRFVWMMLVLVISAWLTPAQQPPLTPLHSIDDFRTSSCDLAFHRVARPGEPFTVSGPQGVIVGEQQGIVESWILPVKLLSHLSVEADVNGYPVPLDLTRMARDLE